MNIPFSTLVDRIRWEHLKLRMISRYRQAELSIEVDVVVPGQPGGRVQLAGR
jgi:hypothetical protein